MKLRGKIRQNAGNKQSFDLTRKILIGIKLVEALKINKHDLTGKIKVEIEGKTRQNSENKHTFGLTGKIEK